MLPDVGFQNFIEVLGIFEHIVGEIAGIDQFNGWIETEPMFSEIFVPDQKTGNHRRACPQRKQSDGRSSCGRYPEEVRKYAFAACGVLIEKNSDRFVLPQGFQNVPRRSSSLYRKIAAQHPITGDQLLDSRIVDRPHDKLQRVSVKSVSK